MTTDINDLASEVKRLADEAAMAERARFECERYIAVYEDGPNEQADLASSTSVATEARAKFHAAIDALRAAALAAAQSPTQSARAFQIADQQMFIVLDSYGIKGDEYGSFFGLCNPEHGEVASLAEAGDELREAVEWLAPRGYVELAHDEHGEHITVLRRPGEA